MLCEDVGEFSKKPNRLMQRRKENVKRDTNIPPRNGFQRKISNEAIKVTRVKILWVKKNDQSCLV